MKKSVGSSGHRSKERNAKSKKSSKMNGASNGLIPCRKLDTEADKSGCRNSCPVDKKLTNGSAISNESEYIRNSESNSKPEDENSDMRIFPRGIQWLVFVVVLSLRVRYVSNKINWWILHPDEIYQSMEVAHSEMYGYGFRPYEYLPPPLDNTSVNPARSQEYTLGMYSLRSFLYPRLFILVSLVVQLTGLRTSPFMIWKVFHSSVTSLMPLSVYKFTHVLYHSHDISCLASILVATSVHLNVLGTHTLLNSFFAPIVFYLLAKVIERLASIDSKTNSLHQGRKTTSRLSESETSASTPLPVESESRSNCDDIAQGTDIILGFNNNIVLGSLNGAVKKAVGEVDNGKNASNLSVSSSRKIFNEIWRFSLCLLYGGVKTKRKFSELSSNATGCQAPNHIDRTDSGIEAKVARRHYYPFDFLHGFLMSLVIYIRLDLMVLICTLLTVFFSRRLKRIGTTIRTLLPFICGFLMGATVAGLQDYCSYGRWFMSPWQWAKFNVFQDFSSEMFGTQEFRIYVKEILFHNYDMVVLFCITCLTAIMYVFYYLLNPSKLQGGLQEARVTFKLALTACLLLVIYSVNGHKEIRFMHNFVVVLLTLYSGAIITLLHLLKEHMHLYQRPILRNILYFLLAVHASSQYQLLPNADDKTNRSWSYKGVTDTNHINICLDFISQQNDVTGVFLDRSIHMTGGYTILHKNVPIIALVHKEFYEFDMKSRLNVTSLPYTRTGTDILKVSTFNQISDYISVYNTPYLLKVLIEKTEYNFLVMKTDRQFIKTGYREMFRSGTMKVLKRNFDPRQEKKMRVTADSIPLGSDPKILEYEASWLMSFGVNSIAEKKLLLSIRLDNQRIRPFQLLSQVYARTGKMLKASGIMTTCQRIHGNQRCREQLPKQVLHEEYNINLPV